MKTFFKKRSWIVALLLVFCIAMSVPVQAQAASTKSNIENFVKYYKVGNFNKASKYSARLPKNLEEPCAKKMSSGMKKAYKKVIKNKRYHYDLSGIKPYMSAYYLADLNNDGKAELLIEWGTCEMDRKYLVYTYTHGEVAKVGSFPAGHMSLVSYPGHRGVIAYWAHQSCEHAYIYYMKSGKLKIKDLGGRDLGYDSYEPYTLTSGWMPTHITYDDNYQPHRSFKLFK